MLTSFVREASHFSGLNRAIAARNIEDIRYMIGMIERTGFDKELSTELEKAKKEADHLCTMRNKTLTVFQCPQATMMALKNLKIPTEQTHSIVQSAVLLLGDNESLTGVG